MSPSQVIADKQATHRGENSERANHHKESERHKLKLSASTMSDKKNLVLFATKSEMREVCENPSSVMHYVLLCKDMTTLDTTKNIAYMYICEVISNANYAIIYLCYPEQKYFTDFCAMSNCRCMGHLYNPHMKIREK
jgi:hypothetical protein